MRRLKLSGFARRLLKEWRRLALPLEAERALVAVSGGADSTALLLACEELRRAGRLGAEVSAAHLNHGLRGEAGEEDARRVAELARGLGFGVVSGRAAVGQLARESGDNLEQAARRARYEFLADAARGAGARFVLVAHTLDDQAETVLLRLLRGSGAEGLGGMRPLRPLREGEDVLLARPLLRWARRSETEGYCRWRGVEPSADEMNADERFARVRVRLKLLPLLETFNPRAVESLGRTAELLREDAATLEREAVKLLEEASRKEADSSKAGGSRADGSEAKSSEAKSSEIKSLEGDNSEVDSSQAVGAESAGTAGARGCRPLRVSVLAGAPGALRRRALRRWIAAGRGDLRRVEMVHVEALERLLEGERGGRVAELPGGSRVERRRGWLFFKAAVTPSE